MPNSCHTDATQGWLDRISLPEDNGAQIAIGDLHIQKGAPMKLLIPPKKELMTACNSDSLAQRVLRLEEQNARLRRSVARLRVYRDMAYRDPLTGLWNRRYFDERLKEEFSRAQRAGQHHCFSIAIADLNGFKEINDQYGHLVGDELLKWVGKFLTTHLRAHDVACRTGGDEFMLLLPDLSAADAGHVIERFRTQLRHANLDRVVPVSLSIGCASWPEISKGCDALLASADAAMYADKRGRKIRAQPSDYRTAA
jgi:diguanylate cyclase (GGDEF)-like protein